MLMPSTYNLFMRRFIALFVMVNAILATIPSTMFDGGVKKASAVYPGQSFTINFYAQFSLPPSVAVLIKGIELGNAMPSLGFELVVDTPTATSTTMTISNLVTNQFATIDFCWAAAVGEHLQLFPITLTIPADHLTQNVVFDVSFDYSNKVQWSPGTFEVAITSVISSFLLYTDKTDLKLDMTIAKWNGADYGYSGDTRYVVDKDALYCPQCPFTTNGTDDVVKMWAGGFAGTVIRSYLIFHKVQSTGTVQTGIGIYRGHDHDTSNGLFTLVLTDATYNPGIID